MAMYTNYGAAFAFVETLQDDGSKLAFYNAFLAMDEAAEACERNGTPKIGGVFDEFRSVVSALSNYQPPGDYFRERIHANAASLRQKLATEGDLSPQGSTKQEAMRPPEWAKHVGRMWLCVREHNQTIPSDDLDLMRDILLGARNA